MSKISPYHVAIAAEAVAATQFARCNCDVSVQYGANQPEYDLIVRHSDRLIMVSVKGSQDGSWPLAVSFLRKGRADYSEAITMWRARQGHGIVMCFVQYQSVGFEALPRMYLATAREVAEHLHAVRKGHGDTVLYEDKAWGTRSRFAGTIDRIPDDWRFSEGRVAALLEQAQPADALQGLQPRVPG